MRPHPGMKLTLKQCAVWAVAIFAASACASTRRSDSADSCVAVVRNNTGASVDAYTTSGVFLATVPPGARSIPLAGRTALVFRVSRESSPDRQFIGFGDRRSRGRVDYDLRCPSSR
jgi:hypothetical protein